MSSKIKVLITVSSPEQEKAIVAALGRKNISTSGPDVVLGGLHENGPTVLLVKRSNIDALGTDITTDQKQLLICDCRIGSLKWIGQFVISLKTKNPKLEALGIGPHTVADLPKCQPGSIFQDFLDDSAIDWLFSVICVIELFLEQCKISEGEPAPAN